jgi:hypothetical protein
MRGIGRCQLSDTVTCEAHQQGTILPCIIGSMVSAYQHEGFSFLRAISAVTKLYDVQRADFMPILLLNDPPIVLWAGSPSAAQAPRSFGLHLATTPVQTQTQFPDPLTRPHAEVQKPQRRSNRGQMVPS